MNAISIQRLAITVFAICLCIAIQSTSAVANSAEDITVGFIKEKKLDDAGSRVVYTIKCTVQNKSESAGEVFVTLQAVDRRGFELDEVLLRGDIRAKGKKTLSEKRRLSHDLYKKIAKWKVKDVNFY